MVSFPRAGIRPRWPYRPTTSSSWWPTARAWPRAPATRRGAKSPSRLHTGIPFEQPGRTLEGSISFIAKPDARADGRLHRRGAPQFALPPQYFAKTPPAGDTVIPTKVGDPCPIKYVLYIIKENRTYDQVFGDMTRL